MDAAERPVNVSGVQGSQIGDNALQINFFGPDTASKPEPAATIVAGDIPQEPLAFQRREDLMAGLRAAGPGVSVLQAVTGMRGVGKTHLAAAYARECVAAQWRLIAWVNAETLPEALTGLAVVADRLGISRSEGIALEIVAGMVRNRLEGEGEGSLVVFDNVTDWDAIRPYVPSCGCQVVMTSTLTAALGRPLPVDVFTPEESWNFLAERIGRHDPDNARTLAEELGYLPLALAQAAAVIARERLTYEVYLQRLRSLSLSDYLSPVQGDRYPRGVAQAILLSIEAATRTAADEDGLCGPLLDLVSLLSPAGVSRDILYQARPLAPPHTVDAALGRLSDRSLLSFSEDGSAVSAHRLVTRVVRERRDHEGTLPALAAEVCAGSMRAIGRTVAEPWRNPSVAREFVTHVVALTEHLGDQPEGLDAQLTKDLLDLRGMALQRLVDLGDSTAQAIDVGQSLLHDQERLLGKSHPDTLRTGNNLAVAYRSAGQLDKAIPLYETTLANRKRVLGESDRETLTTGNNLAVAYRSAGRLREAIDLYEVTLAGREEVLGWSDEDTLTSGNDLAGAYRAAGRLGEAIALFEKALAGSEKALGESHPVTLRLRNNLGYAYQYAEQADRAIPLLEQALAGRARMMGESHPDTLTTQNDLARAYQAAGRLDEATALLERTLAERQRVLGESQPGTLTSRHNLAEAYLAAGRPGEAIPLFHEAQIGRVRVIGASHRNTLMTQDKLASAYVAAGRLAEAVPLLEQTLDQREALDQRDRVAGGSHHETLMTRANLASAYAAAGRLDEAISLYESALAGLENVRGLEHPDTTGVRQDLAAARRQAEAP